MIDDVREAVTFAIDVTPADGQVVITGSLYVVSPARVGARGLKCPAGGPLA